MYARQAQHGPAARPPCSLQLRENPPPRLHFLL